MDFLSESGIGNDNAGEVFNQENKENHGIHQVNLMKTSKKEAFPCSKEPDNQRRSLRRRRITSVYEDEFVIDKNIRKVFDSFLSSQSPPNCDVELTNVHQLMDTTGEAGYETIQQNKGDINSFSIADILSLSVNDNSQQLRETVENDKMMNDQLQNSPKCLLPNQSILCEPSSSTVLSDVYPLPNDENVFRTNWYSGQNACLTLLSETQDSLSDLPTISLSSSAHTSLDRCLQRITSSTNEDQLVSEALHEY